MINKKDLEKLNISKSKRKKPYTKVERQLAKQLKENGYSASDLVKNPEVKEKYFPGRTIAGLQYLFQCS